MKKHAFFAILVMLSLTTSPVQAEQVIAYSIQQPERFVHSQSQSWQTLYSPPKRARNIQVTNRGKLIFEMNQGKDWDWYELDPKTGTNRLIAKSSWFKNGFLSVLPVQRSDGSYYAKQIQSFSSEIYRVSATGPSPFLTRSGLYDFVSLSDGSYAYVIWNGHGTESNDFSDFIPGQQMQLWHKPLSGKAKLLGRFDTIRDLQAVGHKLLFFTPGQQQGSKSWKLIAYDLKANQAKTLTEIPKSSSRGTPQLISWPQSDWIVYETAMPQDHFAERELIRHQVSTGDRQSLGQQGAFMLQKGQGQPGYLTGIQYGPKGSASHELVTYRLSSGAVVQRTPYLWKEIAPDRAIYLP